ncbi:hypothetical protein [Allobranchiibius huperziae]|uniref:DUF2269 family protein n=1 Tax=Allobranchiibius huperziae TaxID=1874116 RepID=A0A853DB91_9MICO|nr:hypothetical protein [Allobranchiibius huperziae]NYJ73867.1 hypothetical protein [Allobranchiibius huperziae]
MTALLLSIHVLAAIVLIGPMTVAASVFPRYARAAAGGRPGAGHSGDPAGPVAVAQAMHRICRSYAAPALVVPVFGIATAVRMHALGQVWLQISMLLTAVAAALLILRIVPGQRQVLTALDPGRASEPDIPAPNTPRVAPATLSRLGMMTGLFSLTWAIVVVLMIIRPGSTTGVNR